ncbi:MAG: glycosyltransferase [Burkholderiaceae bacterium]|jgi:glycosyltransferase involved in cell wall biosynthesis|nr:glycosyltransferase [Burkholderiaceae bacterium]
MKGHIGMLGDASSVHVQRWALEMRARGWRVSLVTARPAPPPLAQAADGQIALPAVARPTDWLWRVGAARRALLALRPDLVHAHYVTSYGYLAARAKNALRCPLVLSAWGSDLLVSPRRSALIAALTRWTLGRADVLTGDSASLLEAARTLRAGVRCELIHWGVDLARFAPVAWAGKPPAFEAVSLRNWEPNYQIPVILRALALARALAPARDLRLHLLGGGSQEAALRALAEALGLREAVTFHGRLDDAGMAAVLARCKLSVSVPQSDATSVSVLESMACGLAVIGSDLSANRHWLDAAALVSALDARALAALWADLALHEDKAQCLGQRNAGRIARDGDRKTQMDAADRLYAQLIASSAAAAPGAGR